MISSVYEADYGVQPAVEEDPVEKWTSIEEIDREVLKLEKQMREAARALEFEKAAEMRDRIRI